MFSSETIYFRFWSKFGRFMFRRWSEVVMRPWGSWILLSLGLCAAFSVLFCPKSPADKIELCQQFPVVEMRSVKKTCNVRRLWSGLVWTVGAVLAVQTCCFQACLSSFGSKRVWFALRKVILAWFESGSASKTNTKLEVEYVFFRWERLTFMDARKAWTLIYDCDNRRNTCNHPWQV